jgi:peroxiredoxin
MPVLDQIQKEFGQQKLLIVGIGIDSPSNIRQFLEKTPISYPVALGGLEGSQIAKSLGNAQGGLPFTVVISPSGKIQGRKLGKISEDELRSFIKQAN